MHLSSSVVGLGVTFAAYKNVNIWLKKAQNGEICFEQVKDLFKRKNILGLGAL